MRRQIWVALCAVLSMVPVAIARQERTERPPTASVPSELDSLLRALLERGFCVDVEAYPRGVRSSLLVADLGRVSRVVERLNLVCAAKRTDYKAAWQDGQWVAVDTGRPAACLKLLPALPSLWRQMARQQASELDGVYSSDGVAIASNAPQVHARYFDVTRLRDDIRTPFTPQPGFMKSAAERSVMELGRVIGPAPALNEMPVASIDPVLSAVVGRARIRQCAPGIWLLEASALGAVNGGASERTLQPEIVFPVLDGNGLARDGVLDPNALRRHGPNQNMVMCPCRSGYFGSQLPLVVPAPVSKQSSDKGGDAGLPVWKEQIAIPQRVLADSGGRVFVMKAQSWQPMRDDVIIEQSPGPLDALMLAVVDGSIFDDELVRLLCYLSGRDATDDVLKAGIGALKK